MTLTQSATKFGNYEPSLPQSLWVDDGVVEGLKKQPPMQGNTDLSKLHGGKFAA